MKKVQLRSNANILLELTPTIKEKPSSKNCQSPISKANQKLPRKKIPKEGFFYLRKSKRLKRCLKRW